MSDTDQTRPSTSITPPPAEVGEPIRTHLGDKLREFYGSILAEPVPDKLTSLLDRLEQQERAAAGREEEKSE